MTLGGTKQSYGQGNSDETPFSSSIDAKMWLRVANKLKSGQNS